MQNTLLKNDVVQNNARKFSDAEQMWFWFLLSRNLAANLGRAASMGKRVCEPIDIETMITKLFLCGKLSTAELNVLKTFGDKRRAPCQHVCLKTNQPRFGIAQWKKYTNQQKPKVGLNKTIMIYGFFFNKYRNHKSQNFKEKINEKQNNYWIYT